MHKERHQKQYCLSSNLEEKVFFEYAQNNFKGKSTQNLANSLSTFTKTKLACKTIFFTDRYELPKYVTKTIAYQNSMIGQSGRLKAYTSGDYSAKVIFSFSQAAKKQKVGTEL